MGTSSRGYIIVKSKEDLTESGITALSRSSKTRLSCQWVQHPSLDECFVHSERAIKRAIRKKRAWTGEAEEAYWAYYNSDTGLVQTEGRAVSFSRLKARFGLADQSCT